jgi:tetratricopeptide (TPR) repeat protein
MHESDMRVSRPTYVRCLIDGSAIFLLLGIIGIPASGQQSRETDSRIQFLQSRVSADPDSTANYNRLASAYLQKARETGDLTYYDLAEKAVRKSLELESSHEQAASTFSLLSTIEFSKHNFRQAAEYAERALQLDPQDLGAAVSAGDAYAELGEYETARKYYAKLDLARHAQRPSLQYLKLSRQAGLALAVGNPKEAISSLEQAVEISNHFQLPRENVAWTQFTLGETYLQLGDPSGAEKAFRASLNSFPGYHRAYGGMAQLRVAQKRYNEAVANYERAIAVIPLPSYVAGLGDVYAKLGKSSEAEKQYQLVEYIAALSFLSKNVYNRELAMFYADHERKLTSATELAHREFEVRHDLYTQDALAWTLFKSGKTTDALNAARVIENYKVQDPILLYHLATIYESAGEKEKSRSYFKAALAVNPQFHIFYADQARELLNAPVIKARNAKGAQ